MVSEDTAIYRPSSRANCEIQPSFDPSTEVHVIIRLDSDISFVLKRAPPSTLRTCLSYTTVPLELTLSL